jgi:hypothetical protein
MGEVALVEFGRVLLFDALEAGGFEFGFQLFGSEEKAEGLAGEGYASGESCARELEART